MDSNHRGLGLTPLNLIVWTKTNADVGSLYRSQHELLPLFKKGDAPHINNVELGKNGRWRSNVWTSPAPPRWARTLAKAGKITRPSNRPPYSRTRTHREDIVLDPFLGSGSTLLASEKTGRTCRGVELDPRYVDVILRRYQAVTVDRAVLIETGESFPDLKVRRATGASMRPAATKTQVAK
jgi:DNA modification methylase